MKFLLISSALMTADPMLYDSKLVCAEAAENIRNIAQFEDAVCIPAPIGFTQDPAQMLQQMLAVIRNQNALTDTQSDSTITEQ